MDQATAIEFLRGGPDGVKAWNAQRPTGPLQEGLPDLGEVDFSGCDIRGADLRKVRLFRAAFIGTDLRDADLRGAHLVHANFTRADLRGANCGNAQLEHAMLVQTRIDRARFESAKFHHAVLEDLDAQSSESPTLGARDPDSPGLFRGARFQHATLLRSSFGRLDLSESNFSNTVLEAVSFNECRLRGAAFNRSLLKEVDFGAAALYGADFEGAELLGCDLQGVRVDQATNLSTVVNIQNTRIDRFTLLTLIGQGVLSEGQRMVMDIHDDVAKLRLAFGGFYRWLHLVALIVFLAPYVWFVVFHHIRAHFAETGEPSIPLASALWRYILTGGRSWAMPAPIAWGPVLLFAAALIYNLIRFLMLWRTASLEHKEQVTTLPQRWTLRDHPVWNVLFNISKWGVAAFVIIAIVNLAYYLWNPIPLPHGIVSP